MADAMASLFAFDCDFEERSLRGATFLTAKTCFGIAVTWRTVWFRGCAELPKHLCSHTAFSYNELNDGLQAFAAPEIGHYERPLAAHPFRVGLHLRQRRADVRREIDLVDHQKVGSRDAGAALRRNLVAGGHVDHVD